ncbi:hypothetical protein COR50_19890 [Chitinophaga caeni]|uniref:Uncharacterized protein n=1 Tax=Chitinophaga caeni TaxID=2029983 RepID=A0A291QZE1_9BACT|nr:hypothetical protein [Chitinophaga caeni]ATL49252.1 hypothetical protein COR50_19890 [Chitinophaga caeni]
MRLKSGKEEIIYLLEQVFSKYERTTGNQVRRNTNRKNYEDLARMLSEISNRLPETAEELQHDHYSPDRNKNKLSYPFLKYDISGGQIKDAASGIVSNPRPFLIDACYIYLYGVGRKGFENNPLDENLLIDEQDLPENNGIDIDAPTATNLAVLRRKSSRKLLKKWIFISLILGTLCIILAVISFIDHQRLEHITKDMRIGVYTPTATDIKNLEGTWLVYIGSPQARKSERNRYHLVVTNIVDVKYKDGYFVFKRYGANFNHSGYMQFEGKNLVSIHSYVENDQDTIESPRLSLLRLEPGKKYQNVISASWSFDTEKYNDIIGIREVYIKQSDNGHTREILNTIENSSCKCKIISLTDGGKEQQFYLKNLPLDSLHNPELVALLDERSILLRNPDSTTIIATH